MTSEDRNRFLGDVVRILIIGVIILCFVWNWYYPVHRQHLQTKKYQEYLDFVDTVNNRTSEEKILSYIERQTDESVYKRTEIDSGNNVIFVYLTSLGNEVPKDYFQATSRYAGALEHLYKDDGGQMDIYVVNETDSGYSLWYADGKGNIYDHDWKLIYEFGSGFESVKEEE